MRKTRIYAVYNGDEFLAVGSADEVAEQMGWTRKTKIYEHLCHQKDGKHPNKRLWVIEVKEDEEDEL